MIFSRRKFLSQGLQASSAVFVLLSKAARAADAQTVRIQGSTTFFDRVLRENREAIELLAGAKLDVVPNKSIWGLMALLEGRCDLAMISADLNKEVASARSKAPNLAFDSLQQVTVARTRVAFITHPSNPVQKLAPEAVKAILLGQVKSWKELGGPDLPVKVIATQDGGGTVMAVRGQLLDGGEISAPNAGRLESPRHVIRAVEQEPNAFGIAQQNLAAKASVKIVDVSPHIEQTLSYVTMGAPSAAVQAVITATAKVMSERTM